MLKETLLSFYPSVGQGKEKGADGNDVVTPDSDDELPVWVKNLSEKEKSNENAIAQQQHRGKVGVENARSHDENDDCESIKSKESGLPNEESGLPNGESGHPNEESGLPKEESGLPNEESGLPNEDVGKQQKETVDDGMGNPNEGTIGANESKVDKPDDNEENMKTGKVGLQNGEVENLDNGKKDTKENGAGHGTGTNGSENNPRAAKRRLQRHKSAFDKVKERWVRSCDSRNEVISKAKSTFDLIIDDVKKDDVTLSGIIVDLEKLEIFWKAFPKNSSELAQITYDKLAKVPQENYKCFVQICLKRKVQSG